MKKKLPERLYYPLPEAAQYLGCSVRDVYHFCATGMITLTVYIKGIESKDVGYMSLDLGSSEITDEQIEGSVNLKCPNAYIHGIHYEHVELEELDRTAKFIRADYIDGFFNISPWNCHLLELSNNELISLPELETSPYSNEQDGVYIFFDRPLDVPRASLCILSSNINKIAQVGEIAVNNGVEHIRTSNRKGELIPSLLKMIPEFSDVDVDTEKACKLADILEATAASKGIELRMPDKNTWSKYLGRK